MNSFEKQTIETFLNEEAQELSQKAFAGGTLTLWRNAHSFPARRVCTFTTHDGVVNVPNNSDDDFYSFLTRAVEMGADKGQLCEVIPFASPVPRRVVVNLQPHLQYLIGVWHTPELNRGNFKCYLENLASGRVELLTINSNKYKIIDAGEGLRFDLR